MRYELAICSGCGFKKPIINKKHNLCLKCNRNRLNVQEMENGTSEVNSKPVYEKKASKPSKRKRISNTSQKMDSGLILYKEVKAKKRNDMIQGKYFRCFFTNALLDPEGSESWHHALGRIGELLYEYRNIFPCIEKYHRDYHDMEADKLMKTEWYPVFVQRLKEKNHKVYNKELNRLLKAKVIDMDTFLQEFK